MSPHPTGRISVLAFVAAYAFCWPGITSASNSQQELGIADTFGRWQGGTVDYVYNPTGAPAVFSDNAYFVPLLHEAMAELEGVSGLDFVYHGIDGSASIANMSDGMVVVGWEDLNGAAGQAGPSWNCTAQDVVDAGYCPYSDGSLRFNNDAGDVTWDTGVAEFTERQLHQVATHELMHLVGIGHSELAQSIMYADPYTNLSHLREDDIAGLQALYGEPEVMDQAGIYLPPASGPSPLQDSFISLSDDIGTEITTIDGSELADFVGLLWRVPNGHTDDLMMYATDPHGYYYNGRVDERDCNVGPGGACLFWLSFASMDSVFTFPGVWTVYAVMNGDLVATESVTVTTNPVFNEAPESTLTKDIVYGPAPLTTKLTLDVTGDNEGDAVDATWHIPGVGEIELDSGDFPGSAGTHSQTVTFDKPGEYEVYVEVNDDWTRYGSGGNAAGAGFRQLYRVVIEVKNVSDDVTTFQDVTGDALPDIAAFTGAPSSKPQINVHSGADGAVHSNIKYLTTSWRGIALGTVRDANQNGIANDPAVAVLAEHETNDRIIVETRRLDTGAVINSIRFLNFKWRPIDVVIIDDSNGDGVSDDTWVGVLAQRRTDGRIIVQIKNFADSTFVKNIGFLNLKWSAIAAAIVDRSPQSMNPISPLIGVLAENRGNGRRFVQSRFVSTGGLDQNIRFFGSSWIFKDVTVLHDVNGDGLANDPGWQVLAVRDSDDVVRVQTRFVADGSPDSNVQILNTSWNGVRLDSSLDISGNTANEMVISLRKRSNDQRLIRVRDYASNATVLDINP